ncbi:sugar ABC transporter substrate-binding protein [Kaistia algarum]|uniref:substrate-binding domain-containing protein n=1 Tax=Kaistia algarum TaxID=2083279 RepID=UPI000CE8087B|nr:substrate-binding domain-containing protein [Kaistia algarum]MCX5515430.1 substrate-binding domain-containing protein [Kaistia algarum]PPE78511.1 sugar ABC transporter substrate-binding protein [Kaistia algarum]
MKNSRNRRVAAFGRGMRWVGPLALSALLGAASLAPAMADDTAPAAAAAKPEKPGYYGVPRTWLWNPGFNNMVDTSKWKKDGPYVIGFSNASISNAWRVAFQHGVLWSAGQHKDQIKKFIVTDANDDPAKQIADIQDLISQGVDLLLIAPATEDALDQVVGRAMKQGIPVVMVDRKVTSPENYITFVTASDSAVGRIEAQWLAEYLHGKGNIVMLPGIAGASPAEIRIRTNKEVFAKYPGIKVLDMQYTDWNPATGKSVMAALIQKYGKQIDGVLADSALQGSGAIEAFIDAGYKKGEFPPITGGDIARMYQLASQYEIPMVGIDYPTSMGITGVETALNVLNGISVPDKVEVNMQIVMSPGADTASVKADRYLLDHVSMDDPGDLSPSNGLPAGYNPSTFNPDYPK